MIVMTCVNLHAKKTRYNTSKRALILVHIVQFQIILCVFLAVIPFFLCIYISVV